MFESQIAVILLLFLVLGAVAVFFYIKRRKLESRTEIPEKAPSAPKSLDEVLKQTRSGFSGRFKSLFSSKDSISTSDLDEIEEILYTSDLGPNTVQTLLEKLQENLSGVDHITYETLRDFLKKDMSSIFDEVEESESIFDRHWDKKPVVWMIIGVNGAGKTTTIGKLSHQLAKEKGKKVLIGAGDTFRAAAKEQLEVWSDRAKVDIFAPENAASPSGLAFDAAKKAQTGNYDILILDTAGRLHTQQNLMEELKKVQRVLDKALPGSPHETLLVLDANQGQNALLQAKQFHEQVGVSGVILTKLDGSAKGGVALGVACELKLPIRLVGVGEKIEDLRGFSSREFVDSII